MDCTCRDGWARREALSAARNACKSGHGDFGFDQSEPGTTDARRSVSTERRAGDAGADESALAESADGQAHDGGGDFFAISHSGNAERDEGATAGEWAGRGTGCKNRRSSSRRISQA